MTPSIPPHRRLPLAYLSGFWSLVILLLVTNVPAYAEWVMFSGNEEAGLIVYVDPDTIRRKGDLVKMWHLKDFKTNQSSAFGEYLSYKVLDQYDCAEERKRMLSATHFSHNMGNGLTVNSIVDEGKWYPVEPGSVGEAQWMFACGNRSSRREGRPPVDTKSQRPNEPVQTSTLVSFNRLGTASALRQLSIHLNHERVELGSFLRVINKKPGDTFPGCLGWCGLRGSGSPFVGIGSPFQAVIGSRHGQHVNTKMPFLQG